LLSSPMVAVAARRSRLCVEETVWERKFSRQS
jgi:hypothetical protein